MSRDDFDLNNFVKEVGKYFPKEDPNLIRSENTKKSFIKYLEDNPSQRFWQAVRNFSGESFVFVGDLTTEKGETIYPKNLEDTFYREEL